MSEERYEIRGKIGQGGVGAVYRAYDTQLRREVAIKRVLAEEEDTEGLIDAEVATKNLLKEATALSSVQHPHICTVYDAGIDKEGPYVVMELINGKTLDEMVERGTLTYDDFREVAIQTQEAMIAAQDLDLVHRDLKPSNVMVCWLPSGRFQVKLVDFGLAKFSAKPSLQTIDHGDAVFGSIFFMAPEQFERTPLDRRTDMYALGCMYYYSLAGTYPFNGDSAPQVMASHLQNSVQPLQELRPDLPLWVCEWVMWHLSRNMDDRPESARAALEKYLLDETTAAQNGGTMPQRTGPQLITPATNTTAQGNRPATPSATVNTKTAPQSIAPPTGTRVLTSAQPVRPATTVTGATAIQPARPYIEPNSAGAPQEASQESTPTATTPQLSADALSEATAAAKKKKLLIMGLGGAVVLAGAIALSTSLLNSDTKVFNTLMEEVKDPKAKSLPTSQKQAEVLIASLYDPEVRDKTYIYRRLMLAEAEDGLNLDALLFDEATKVGTPPQMQEMLAKVIEKRANPAAMEKLLDYAVENPNSSLAETSVAAITKNATDAQFTSLLKILETTEESSIRSKAEKALKFVIEESADKDDLSAQLLGTVETSVNKTNKLAMLRLLGATGTKPAQDLLTKTLKSRDSQERIAAATAFGSWSTHQPFDAMLDAFVDEDSATAKNTLFKSVVKLLQSKTASKRGLNSRWLQLADQTSTPAQKKTIISAAVKAQAGWSKEVVTYFTQSQHDKGTRDYANAALSRL